MNKKNRQIMYITRISYALSLFVVGIGLRLISKSYLILGNVAMGIGAVVLAFCLLKFFEMKYSKPVKILNKLLTYGVILFSFAFATTQGAIIYGYETGDADADNPDIADIEADYIIVLGAPVGEGNPTDLLRVRLEAALKYLELHPETVCIVSGGITSAAQISEAEYMYTWLTENGISGERIIKEEKAQDTYQNIKFSYEILLELDRDASVAVITGDYHVLRAKLMAKLQGYDPCMIGAETEGLLVKVNFYVREVFALWNRLIFGYKTA